MIDINLLRTNPDKVRENIKKKFQDRKLPLVDEVLELDKKSRDLKQKGDAIRAQRNTLSAEIGKLMKAGKKEEAEKVKQQVANNKTELENLEKEQEEIDAQIKKDMMSIPNIIADDVPLGEDDSKNVEGERFLEPKVPDFEVPYHTDIFGKTWWH